MCPALAADPEWLNAEQAATRLGVSRPTLYAYVSRGRLRAHARWTAAASAATAAATWNGWRR
jgi:predicted site-specific integrase-resolvase